MYSADLLYILALWTSKSAMLLVIRRITRRTGKHRISCYIIGGFVLVSIWAVASLFTVAIRCDTSAPWSSRNTNQCSDLVCLLCGVEPVTADQTAVQPMVGYRDHQLVHRGLHPCTCNVHRIRLTNAPHTQIQSPVSIHDSFAVRLSVIRALL